MTVNVACVLKSGGIYNASWVRKLRDGVARHLTIPHRFVCLSDVDVPCERIPLERDWPGWWSKIELFKRGQFDGPVLSFDLDTIVVGSLDRVASYPHEFTGAHDFYHGFFCSTAMAWNGDYSFIHEAFAADPNGVAAYYDGLLRAEKRIGDQAFIEDQLRLAEIKPDVFRDLFSDRTIASYKVHGCMTGYPIDAAVVAFHGRPKPHQITTGWVPKIWK